MRATRIVAAVLFGAAVLACSAPQTAAPSPSGLSATERPTVRPGGCPVSLAFQRPPDQVIDWARAGASPTMSHEQAVELAKQTNWAGADGIWIPLPTDGRVTWGSSTSGSKFPLWMTASGVATATARRLDAATPLGVTAHFNGANPSGRGPGFNSSSITFPTNGCWEVTYRVGDATLTFVVDVAHS